MLANKPEITHQLLEVPDVNVNAVCSLQRPDGAQFKWSIVHEVCRFVLMTSVLIDEIIPLADLRGGGAGTPPPGAQILLISCSIRENLAKSYVGASLGGGAGGGGGGGWRPPPPGRKSWIRH